MIHATVRHTCTAKSSGKLQFCNRHFVISGVLSPPTPTPTKKIVETKKKDYGVSSRYGYPPPPRPLQTKVTVVGQNEMSHRENLIGPLLVHKRLGPSPPPPPPPLLPLLWGCPVGPRRLLSEDRRTVRAAVGGYIFAGWCPTAPGRRRDAVRPPPLETPRGRGRGPGPLPTGGLGPDAHVGPGGVARALVRAWAWGTAGRSGQVRRPGGRVKSDPARAAGRASLPWPGHCRTGPGPGMH